jgi:hypothetical protein
VSYIIAGYAISLGGLALFGAFIARRRRKLLGPLAKRDGK